MAWLIGCEESGGVRDAVIARGIPAVSCDLKPTRKPGPHIQGDVIEAIGAQSWEGLIAFPDCTYLTCSAEWAYTDGPYHMKLKPGTLTGQARRDARERAIAFALTLWYSFDRVVIENPVGVLSRVLGKPQVVHPYMFGDDASKATCFWIKGLPPLQVPPRSEWVPPRLIEYRGKVVKRWGNQAPCGAPSAPPGPDRARDRAVTYPGIAKALAALLPYPSAPPGRLAFLPG
jgi:hypothetical protein